MRIALVGPELEENLALRYLHASLLRAGHEALIFDFHSPEQTAAIARQILAYAPHIVGLSMVFTGRAREFAALAGMLTGLGYSGHITAGGHFASFHAEQLLSDVPAIDSIVHGEGEAALVDLAGRLADLGAVSGISYRGEGGTVVHTAARTVCTDLDALPWPTRTPPFHRYLGIPIANVLSSRGCFGNCSFCSIAAWHKKTGGPRFRQRAPQCIAREMATLYHEHDVRIFNFHDDNFFLPSQAENLARFSALRSALDREGVGQMAVQVKARPDSINEEVVLSLKELGLFRAFLGVESNAVAGLRTLGRGIRREQNHEALRILESSGIHTTFNLLMFDPETTWQDYDENVDFLEAYARFPLNFGRVEAYTGTPLADRLRAEGRLKGDYWGHSYEIRDPRVECSFQLFKPVFTPRNFEDGAVNLLGMKVDYLLHILTHFRPTAAPAALAADCRRAIKDLNCHSVALLRAIRRKASGPRGFDGGEQTELVSTLAAERRVFDERMRRRMEMLIQEIEKRSVMGKQRAFPIQAAAAAAAIVISVSGCRQEPRRDGHIYEMIAEPTKEQREPPTPVEKPSTPTKPEPKDEPKPEPKDGPKPKREDWHIFEMMPVPMEPKGKP